MWLSKLRPHNASTFALQATATGFAVSLITGSGMVYLCNAPLDMNFAPMLKGYPAHTVACAKRLTHSARGPLTVPANSADGFVYRAHPAQDPPQLGYGKTLTVGRGKEYPTISRAVLAAQDGDIIAIAPGTYVGESMIIARNNLILRGQDGVAIIDAAHGPVVQDKAILITQGHNILLENLELKNAVSVDDNGAAIRAEGPSLFVRHCFIHDNQSGILVSNRGDSTVVVEYSEFARNGHRDGQSHQIYAGLIAQLSLRYNFIHDSVVGSAIKSRAAHNVIEYNFVVDGATGSANYTVDLSAGGYALLVGNVFQKGPRAQNHTFVSYAPESLPWQDNALFMSHNTLVNDRFDSNFINNHAAIELHAINNLFIGRGAIVAGGAVQLTGNIVMNNTRYGTVHNNDLGGSVGSGHNRSLASAEILDRARLDYRLTRASAAIDAAVPIPAHYPAALTARWQYHHPADRSARPQLGAQADSGAFEFAEPQTASAATKH